MDDAFHCAGGYTEFFRYGFVVDVFDVFVSDGFAILFAASLFGQQAFDGFAKEVGAVLTFVAFCFDEKCSFCSFIIDEGSLTRVVVVEFDCTAAALGADDATRRDVFNSRSFGLP